LSIAALEILRRLSDNPGGNWITLHFRLPDVRN
jgi:hypothetical protein